MIKNRMEGMAWTYHYGDRVKKKSGGQWRGVVVGHYSTELTVEGYAVESLYEPGSVQIYPVTALEPFPEVRKDSTLDPFRKESMGALSSRRVRINVGAFIGQDFGFGHWPATGDGSDVDPCMVFDAEWNGKAWECRADGYGRRAWCGETGNYGNGAIIVFGYEGVTVLDEGAS